MSPSRPAIRTAVVRPPASGAPPRKVAAAPAPSPSPRALPECWRVARVARVLDVSRKRVYQLIRERRLEVVRVGPRQIRVLRASLDDFLARLRREEADRDY